MPNGGAPPGEDLLFQTYKDKSESLQRTLIIFLGVSFFFFFMVLMPYYSLKVDAHGLSNLYGLLNKTSDDIQYITQALLDQYKQYKPQQQNSNLTKEIDLYAKQLTNQTTDIASLKKIEYPDCRIFAIRSGDWVKCNSDIKIEEVQEKLHAMIKFNNTTTERIREAISTQEDLMDQSNGFLDTNKFVSIKGTLENLSSAGQKPILELYGLQPAVHNLTQGVNKQISNLLIQMNDLSSRFKLLQTPLGGTLPMGFNEMLAVFPLALSVVFCYLAMTLRDTIKLRKTLETTGSNNIKSYLDKASLWIDPKRPTPEQQKGRTLHSIMAWTVLAIPLILFIMSVILILSTWYSITIKGDKFPPFVAAIGFNEVSYEVIYVISGGIFVFSYTQLIKESG